MPSRKRAKSLEDIMEQQGRIAELAQGLVGRARSQGDSQSADRTIRRAEAAYETRTRYWNNIQRTPSFKNMVRRRDEADYNGSRDEYNKRNNDILNRKYVDYATDRAKAASNG